MKKKLLISSSSRTFISLYSSITPELAKTFRIVVLLEILKNKGKKILSYEWKENLNQMNDSIMNSPAEIIYNNDNYSELSFFWDDLYGIRGKCRPDCLSYNDRFVLDLKTTQDGLIKEKSCL